MSDNAALRDLLDRGGRIVIPPGTYDIDAVQSLWPKSGSEIILDDVTLRVIPNGNTNYHIFGLRDVEDVTIRGGELIGDRDQHQGSSGEWGYGVYISSNARNILIDNVVSREMWGDGFFIGDARDNDAPRDITLQYCTADHNRRQGLSITTVNGATVFRSKFMRTIGAAPEAGIDLEPYEPEGGVYNVVIKENILQDNKFCGVFVMGQYGPIHNVEVTGNKFKGNTPIKVDDVDSNYKGKKCFRCKEQTDLKVK